ncbi:ribonucleotide-diphosphate reductase subunit beta, partial [Pseudomonas sp. SDO524_S393]
MLSWDEVDNEDTNAAVIKSATAADVTMDRLDGAGAAAALEARSVTATDSAAIIRAKAALDKLDIA